MQSQWVSQAPSIFNENNLIRPDHPELVARNPLNIGIAVNNLLQFTQVGQISGSFLQSGGQLVFSLPDPGHLLFLFKINGEGGSQDKHQQHPYDNADQDPAAVQRPIMLFSDGFHVYLACFLHCHVFALCFADANSTG